MIKRSAWECGVPGAREQRRQAFAARGIRSRARSGVAATDRGRKGPGAPPGRAPTGGPHRQGPPPWPGAQPRRAPPRRAPPRPGPTGPGPPTEAGQHRGPGQPLDRSRGPPGRAAPGTNPRPAAGPRGSATVEGCREPARRGRPAGGRAPSRFRTSRVSAPAPVSPTGRLRQFRPDGEPVPEPKVPGPVVLPARATGEAVGLGNAGMRDRKALCRG